MYKGSYKYNFAKVKTLESIRSQKLNPLHASQSQYVARKIAVHTEKAETIKAKEDTPNDTISNAKKSKEDYLQTWNFKTK